MTIFGSGYREIRFAPRSTAQRIWPLAFAEFRLLFRSRWGVLTYVFCLFPALFQLALLLIRTGVWQVGGPSGSQRQRVLGRLPGAGPDAVEFYVQPAFAGTGTFLVAMILTTVIASRAVARDRESQALELLWTRGVSPAGYFAGKWCGAFLLLGIGGIAAPLLLWLAAWATVDDAQFLAHTAGFLPRLVLGLGVFTAVISGLAVAFSALFRSANVASMVWVFVMFASDSAAFAFEALLRGETWLRAISPWDATRRVAEALVGVTPRVGAPLEVALGVLAVLGAGLGVVVAWRLRSTEAVG